MAWLPADNGHYAVWKNCLKCHTNARLAHGHSQCSADTVVWPQSVFSRHCSMASQCSADTAVWPVSVQQTLQYGHSILQYGHSILQYGQSVFSRHCSMASQCSADTAVWPQYTAVWPQYTAVWPVSVQQTLQYGHSQCSADTAVWPVSVQQTL